MSWPALNTIRSEHIGRALALMLVFWSPFSGGPRVFSALLAVMGGWLIYRERAALFTRTPILRWSIVFLLLWIPLLLSVPGSLMYSQSLKITASLPLYFLAGVALIHSLRRDADRLWLIKGIGLTLALWLADGLVQYVLGRDLIGVPLATEGRIVGAFGSNLRLALFVAVFAPIGLWLLLPKGVAWIIGLYFAGAFVVLLSGSRMTLVMMLLVAAGVYWRATWRYKLPLLMLALVVAGGLLALASNHPLVQERLERTRAIGEWTFTGIDTALSGRLTIWETAGRMIADRPLTGIGAGGFRHAYDRYSTRPDDPYRTGGGYEGGVYHAHQMYVSIAAESGIIGLAGILLALFLCVKWYWTATPARRDLAWPFAFGLLVAVFPINSQPVIYTHWWFPILLLLLCASLAALDPAADSSDSESTRKLHPRTSIRAQTPRSIMDSPLKTLSRTLRIPLNRYTAFKQLKRYHARPRSLEETVDWAMHYGGGGYFTVKTLQIPTEITALAREVAQLEPKIILEIGTARGGTLLIWSQLASEQVISCDLRDMHVQAPLFQSFPQPGSSCRVTLLSGNSHDAAFKQRVTRELDGRKADFIFIDGDHSEAGVSADYHDYREFARPGGIIAFHDIVERQPLPGNQVYPFWQKVKRDQVTEEFVNDPKQCGFGIGIIRVPA